MAENILIDLARATVPNYTLLLEIIRFYRCGPNFSFQDLPAAVRRVAAFLDKDFSEDEIAKLCDHLNIDNFKKNKSVNFDIMKELGILIPGEQAFIRKGKG